MPLRWLGTARDGVSDFCTDNNDALSCDDDCHNQHLDTQAGRVQVFLRTEHGQLGVQMLVGLLHGVRRMCSNYDNDNGKRVDNGKNNGYDSHTCFNNSIATGLQVLVCRQWETLAQEVHMGQVPWVC